MDYATALARLQNMTQWQSAPALTAAELDNLLLFARRPDDAGRYSLPAWEASSGYNIGDQVIPTAGNGHIYTVTVGGVSGTVEPVWTVLTAGTVHDGTLTWQEAGPYQWVSTYDLHAAAAEGWQWKAGKVLSKYDVAPQQGMSFSRSQVQEYCLKMADYYRRGIVGSIRLERAH